MSDPFDLQRFVDEQERGGAYEQALDELRAGQKHGHWIWYVLPQVRGLGSSPNAQRFGISGLDEARAYLQHPVLGPRLLECARVLTAHAELDPTVVMGSPLDAQKTRSSMTLFAHAAPEEPVFRQVLDQWFDGREDPATLERL